MLEGAIGVLLKVTPVKPCLIHSREQIMNVLSYVWDFAGRKPVVFIGVYFVLLIALSYASIVLRFLFGIAPSQTLAITDIVHIIPAFFLPFWIKALLSLFGFINSK